MQEPIPTRPADLTGASLRELLDAWYAHLSPLVSARHRIGEPEAAEQLARHALAALTVGQELADRLMAMRWTTVAEALTFGAPLEQTAAAMGLEVDEVAAGLRSWADGQHAFGLITSAARDEVYALLSEVDR